MKIPRFSFFSGIDPFVFDVFVDDLRVQVPVLAVIREQLRLVLLPCVPLEVAVLEQALFRGLHHREELLGAYLLRAEDGELPHLDLLALVHGEDDPDGIVRVAPDRLYLVADYGVEESLVVILFLDGVDALLEVVLPDDSALLDRDGREKVGFRDLVEFP